MLLGTCQLVEERGLSAVLVAHECQGQCPLGLLAVFLVGGVLLMVASAFSQAWMLNFRAQEGHRCRFGHRSGCHLYLFGIGQPEGQREAM